MNCRYSGEIVTIGSRVFFTAPFPMPLPARFADADVAVGDLGAGLVALQTD